MDTHYEADALLVDSLLSEKAVWNRRPLRNEEPVANTIATLRAFATSMAREDAEAAGHVRLLLTGPRERWLANLHRHPHTRTAGTVRALLAATDRALDTMPPDAVEMTRLAVEIVEGLDGEGLGLLTGQVWRTRGYALYYVGDFIAADEACDEAEAAFEACAAAAYDRARLGIVRSLVARSLERIPAAISNAEQSSKAFAAYGDAERQASACMAETNLLIKINEYDGAIQKLERVAESPSISLDTRARLMCHLGICYSKLGNADAAVKAFEEAITLFDLLDTPTEASRTRWQAACLYLDRGDHDRAALHFNRLLNEFTIRGMKSEAAMTRLDLAEVHLARREYHEVEELCGMAIDEFRQSGVAYASRALTAIAYMQDAARNRAATPTLIREVRTYVRRLPKEPQLLFAYPA